MRAVESETGPGLTTSLPVRDDVAWTDRVSAPVRADPPPACPEPVALHDHRVRPVFGMDALVEELCDAIQAARSRIYADYYVLGGRSGRTVAEALIARHREGLDVRVLLDPWLGTFWPLRPEALPVKALLDERSIPLRLAVTRRGGRVIRSRVIDHNKVVVIDGHVTFVGGTNITDIARRFYDLTLRVDGPLAGQAERQFLHDWALSSGARVAPTSDVRFHSPGLLANESAPGLATVRMVGTGPGRLTLADALLNAIDSAREAIDVHVHLFDYAAAVEALIRAHRRGVAVRVIVDPLMIKRYIPAEWLILRSPRGIFNAYAVHTLRRAGVPVRFIRLQGAHVAYHMKLALFDGRVALVGTSNWTRRSMTVLTETVLEVSGGPLAPTLRAWFDDNWNGLADDASVGIEARVYDAMARLLL